jgi:hypothetical protein
VSLIEQVLFPPADYQRTALSTVGWWERRRGTYNVVVGLTGTFTLLVVELLAVLPPGPSKFFVPIPGILVYGLAANVCYSLGWMIELALQRVMKRRAPAIAPALYRQGLAFAVGLTLLPIPIAIVAWGFRVLAALAR